MEIYIEPTNVWDYKYKLYIIEHASGAEGYFGPGRILIRSFTIVKP